jgi:putative ABC transport system permease protein
MNKLFGIPMTSIMIVLVALFAICLAGVAAIYLANRTMFRMGLRNLPRRGAQTLLVVVGLMLATLIITASFTTGDTLDYSVTTGSYNALQRSDLALNLSGDISTNALLGGSQTYLNQSAVPTLETRFQGDPDIEGFLPFLSAPVPALNPRTRLSEPAVDLSGIDSVRLAHLGGLTLMNGKKAALAALQPDQVLVSATTAGKLNVRDGDTLTLYGQGRAWQLHVVGIVRDELASGVLGPSGSSAGGIALPLATAQQITGHAGQVNLVTVALKGGVRGSLTRSDAAAGRLDSYLQSAAGRQVLGLGSLTVRADTIKQDNVKSAEQFGNLFTSLFLVLGLFSIAAGIMLIFMIFVMLAAERREEMGMARAVGTRRSQLVQAFVSEGMAYNLLAGALGAALGVGAAFLLVVVGIRLVLGGDASFIAAHVTARSLVVSYCLGVVLTFATVVLSSLRITRLNIVAAIRGTDDHGAGREARRKTRWLWVALGLPALVVPPLGLWFLLRKGFGLPWAWILGPLGIGLGLLSFMAGGSSGQAFPLLLGASLVPLASAALARSYGANSRLTWTLVGGVLAALWLLPVNWGQLLFGKKTTGGIEMFVLSGIMVIVAFTLLIAFNARLLTTLFENRGSGRIPRPAVALTLGAPAAFGTGIGLGNAGGGLGQLFYLLAALLTLASGLAWAAARFPRFAPALKMGVAHPLANRFRTGMTIAMFGLIIFSLVMFGVWNANLGQMSSNSDGRAGWSVRVDTNSTNPIADLTASLRQNGFNTAPIIASGRVSEPSGPQNVRQAGQSGDWTAYPVHAADDAFLANSETKLKLRASGYASDQAVFTALRSGQNLAIVDDLALAGGGFGPSTWQVKGVTTKNNSFAPFPVEVRDPATGKTATYTVIGVLSTKIPANVMTGIYTNAASYAAVFGQPQYQTDFLRLRSGVDAAATAKAIKAAVLTDGVEAVSIQQQINAANAQSQGFVRIFQAFMGLGLLVGIAALGVIAFRSVVERRQQIGMLRAIGYQRGTVSLTFLLESSFVAMMGILSGVVGAVVLSANLFNSGAFGSEPGNRFTVPWTEILAFVLVAYLFSLLMTWWPSRGAARVPIAEALRYE